MHDYHRVPRHNFAIAYHAARWESPVVRDATSPVEEVCDGRYTRTLYCLAEDWMSGFAIRPGDEGNELIGVFSLVKGRGSRLIEAALDMGAERLDCFDGFLVDFYQRHGFVETERVPNWTEGEPDVVFMRKV